LCETVGDVRPEREELETARRIRPRRWESGIADDDTLDGRIA
jgi:hypothetical protein